ncbi:MAG: hypothetical protein AB1442_06085 [Nitrospirota bacterium]
MSGVCGRLLGQVLLDGEFITLEHLQEALEEQKRTNRLLGEILVRMGVLDPSDLKAVLSISKDLASPGDSLRLAAGVRLLLGELLLMGRRVTPHQLDHALSLQRETGEKLGDVFIRLGLITGKERDAVLKFQEFQEDKSRASDRLRLGELLVLTTHLTRDQLDHALADQKRSGENIGEILVVSGHIRPEQLSYGVKLQKRLLSCALISLLSLASFPAASAADMPSDIPASGESAISSVSAGETLSALKILYQSPELAVTQTDIRRGYIDIPLASRIEIQNSNLAGYLIAFDGVGGPFAQVIVKGFGKDVVVDTRGTAITQPYHGRDPLVVELSCRVVLSENARPGAYAWPVKIAISPVIPV